MHTHINDPCISFGSMSFGIFIIDVPHIKNRLVHWTTDLVCSLYLVSRAFDIFFAFWTKYSVLSLFRNKTFSFCDGIPEFNYFCKENNFLVHFKSKCLSFRWIQRNIYLLQKNHRVCENWCVSMSEFDCRLAGWYGHNMCAHTSHNLFYINRLPQGKHINND